MKPRSSRLSDVERVLKQLGFYFDHQAGSHRTYYREADRKRVGVSYHGPGEIPMGELRRVIRDLGITVQQYNELA